MDAINKKSIEVNVTEDLEKESLGISISASSTKESRERTTQSGQHAAATKLLAQPPLIQWFHIAWDLLMCIIPLLLIIKIIIVLIASHLSGKRTSDGSDPYDIPYSFQAVMGFIVPLNDQLTTLFTIIFAIIVSTMVRRVALWRAQKGATIAKLEQLQGSTSFQSTFKVAFALRMFTMSSVALVFLWSWYYLGSQAARREYFERDTAPYKNIKALYLNSQAPSALDNDFYDKLKNAQKALYNAKFAIATTSDFQADWNSPGEVSPGWDSAGNMLLPLIRNTQCNSPNGCYASQFSTSSSNVGLSIYPDYPYNISNSSYYPTWAGMSADSIKLNTTFLLATCDRPMIRNLSDFPAGTMSSFATSINLTNIKNTTVDTDSTSRNQAVNFDIWYRTNDSTTPINTITSTCNITTVLIEVHGNCTIQGCQAIKVMDLSQHHPDMINRTVFDDSNYANRFFNEMLQSLGTPSDQNDTTVVDSLDMHYELLLLNDTFPANIQVVAENYNESVEYATRRVDGWLEDSATELSDSVTNMVNTYQTIFQQARIDLYNMDGTKRNDNIWNSTNHTDSVNLTTLHGNFYDPRWVVSIPWIIIDFISCVVLFFAAAVSYYLRTRILAPDIFGYVSSLTRDNPNMDLPEVGSTLDGMTRARKLKQVKVQIADVGTTGDTGRVGFVHAGPSSHVQAARLRRDQYYV